MTNQPEFVPLCSVDDVKPGEARHYRPTQGALRLKPVAVWNDNGAYHITNYVCPHSGGPLSEGKIENGVLECPWHQWQFDAATGKSARSDGHVINVYECKVEDGQILIGGVKA